jgi:membrane protease YdiL (CAAX protease family)
MLAGPSCSGIVLTGIVHGRAGFRDFARRLLAGQVGIGWYAVALLTAPLVAAITLLALGLFSSAFTPGLFLAADKRSALLFAFAVALAAGFFEELGWTGFAIPELRRRLSVPITGAIVGATWGAWHLLVVVWGVGDRSGTLPVAVFAAVDVFSFLPAFRMLMVWVYDHTRSLLIAMLMHVSLTATTLTLWPVTTGTLTFDVAFAIVVWMIVAAIAAATRGQLSRHAAAMRAA